MKGQLLVVMGLLVMGLLVMGLSGAVAEQLPQYPTGLAWESGESVAVAPVMDAAADRPAAATRSFKAALNNAATAAHREGKITRWQLARLRLAITFRPDAMAEAQACVIDQGIQDGVLRDGADAIKDGFDWQRLLEFIKQFLPLIMQIIAVL